MTSYLLIFHSDENLGWVKMDASSSPSFSSSSASSSSSSSARSSIMGSTNLDNAPDQLIKMIRGPFGKWGWKGCRERRKMLLCFLKFKIFQFSVYFDRGTLVLYEKDVFFREKKAGERHSIFHYAEREGKEPYTASFYLSGYLSAKRLLISDFQQTASPQRLLRIIITENAQLMLIQSLLYSSSLLKRSPIIKKKHIIISSHSPWVDRSDAANALSVSARTKSEFFLDQVVALQSELLAPPHPQHTPLQSLKSSLASSSLRFHFHHYSLLYELEQVEEERKMKMGCLRKKDRQQVFRMRCLSSLHSKHSVEVLYFRYMFRDRSNQKDK